MEELLRKILEKIKKGPFNYQSYEDLYYICLEALKTDTALGTAYLKPLSEQCEYVIKESALEEGLLRKLFGLHKNVLLAAAPYDFESFLLYIEWNREPERRFYPPRRKALKPIVEALQELCRG